MLPHANRASVTEEDIPPSVLKEINIVFVRTIDEVMRVAFPDVGAGEPFAVPHKSAL
jgi:ATP-dependent Lon protease